MENIEKYTPAGFIKIYEDGELIRETHNMIVKSGRKIILQSVFGLPSANKIDPLNFNFFYELSSTTRYTTPELAYSELIDNNASQLITIEVLRQDHTDSSGIDLNKINIGNMCMEIREEIVPDIDNIGNPIVAIGLLYGDNILFSRANVDPVYMKSGKKYCVEYNIYF